MSAENPAAPAERPTRKLFRQRVEKQLQKEADIHRRELMIKRMDLAKEGVKLYQKGHLIEAMKHYQRYLLILEMMKQCGRDQLDPKQFDREKDIYELILINGVYWDICRLYDRAKNEHQLKELKMMLDKFVLFSKGFAYQPLACETIRRYVGSGKCKHVVEFKATYLALGGARCFVASSLVDLSSADTIPTLRRFRDQVLRRQAWGRTFVAFYYKNSPQWAVWLQKQPRVLRLCVARALDQVARVIALFI